VQNTAIVSHVTPYDIVTFDCYGTLIDWLSGIRTAFASTAIERYGATEAEVERTYRPYREVLAETARRIVGDGSFLAESLPAWPPFPDTNPALERMRAAGIRLGILSNIDDDLLAATRRHFTVGFDLIVTAQQVRSYKPGHAHFLAARERIGNARWLHAAQSNYHDIAPCNALGIDNAWINRLGETGERPTIEFRDLAGLADWLTTTPAR
jgi:2-haloalkanoic acid dehalogenase type II